MDETRASAKRAVIGGLFSTACAALALASWHGFHADWRDVASHATLAGVVVAIIAFFSEDDDRFEERERSRFDKALLGAAHVVFLATGGWALTGADLPNAAIFALTASGVWVIANLVGVFAARRRERDQLGL